MKSKSAHIIKKKYIRSKTRVCSACDVPTGQTWAGEGMGWMEGPSTA